MSTSIGGRRCGHTERPLLIIVYPSSKGRFTARLEGEDVELCRSYQPFLDSARRLIEQGYDPDATLVMRHADSTTISLKATLAVAARLRVDEDRRTFAPYKPYCSAAASRIAAKGKGATPVAKASTPC